MSGDEEESAVLPALSGRSKKGRRNTSGPGAGAAQASAPAGAKTVAGRARAVICALQSELRESEERFHCAFQYSPIGMAFISPEGKWLRVNAEVSSILGYYEEELAAKSVQEVTHPDDWAVECGRRRRMLNGEFPSYTMEKRYFHKKGHMVWALVAVAIVKDSAGDPSYFISQIEDITERKRTEEALVASRLQLARAMDLADLVNWEYDVPADRFSFDDRFYALYGSTAEREGGSQMSSADYARVFVHPEDVGMVGEEIATALACKDARYVRELEHRIVRRDGEIRHIVVHVEILRDPQGQILRYHGANQDITERKKAMMAVQAGELRNRLILEAALDAVVTAEESGTITGWNPQAERTFGWAAQEAIGKNMFELLFLARDRPIYREQVRSYVETGAAPLVHQRVSSHMVCSDGRQVPVELALTAICTADGVVVTAFIQDISERQAAEDALNQAHRQLNQMISAIPYALVVFDDQGLIMTYNHVAKQLFPGILAATPTPHVWDLPINWDYTATRIDSDTAELRDKLSSDDACTELVRRLSIPIDSGSGVRFYDVAVSCGGLQRGENPSYLLSAVDVTDQRNLQAQLSQSQKLESIGQLAAGIAHEINTPTQYVSDNIRFLKRATESLIETAKYQESLAGKLSSLPGGEEISEETAALHRKLDFEYLVEQIPLAISQSLDGLARVTSIVRAMKEFSHPDGTASAIDLNHAIESTISVSRNEWKYVADLDAELDPGLPNVTCHAGEINQVVLNLLVNAAHTIGDVVQGSGEKGRIVVRTRSLGSDEVEITISDTGGGIPEEVRSKIFDPFFTTKEVGKGTGQGLSIAHNIVVKHHGGKIDFTTEMGKGTSFRVVLPVVPPVGLEGRNAA